MSCNSCGQTIPTPNCTPCSATCPIQLYSECVVYNGNPLTTLSTITSGTNLNDFYTAVDNALTGSITVNFDCSLLDQCDLSALGNVTGGESSGNILVYNGTSWNPADPSTIVCTAITNAACSINVMGDVQTSSNTSGDLLTWNGTNWINSPFCTCLSSANCDLTSLMTTTVNGLITSQAWLLGGNATGSSQNMGSTTNYDVAFIRNSVESFRIGKNASGSNTANLIINKTGTALTTFYPLTVRGKDSLSNNYSAYFVNSSDSMICATRNDKVLFQSGSAGVLLQDTSNSNLSYNSGRTYKFVIDNQDDDVTNNILARSTWGNFFDVGAYSSKTCNTGIGVKYATGYTCIIQPFDTSNSENNNQVNLSLQKSNSSQVGDHLRIIKYDATVLNKINTSGDLITTSSGGGFANASMEVINASTYTLANHSRGGYLTRAAGTAVTMNSSPIDGEEKILTAHQATTGMSFVANTGQTVVGGVYSRSAAVSGALDAGQTIFCKYRSSNTTWYIS